MSVAALPTARHTVTLPEADAFAAAREVLGGGGLAALPTETVYGLAADARSPRAVAALYRAKGRPARNPLIVHVADLDQVEEFAQVGDTARRLAAAFWPGPLTMVLKRRGGILADAACAGGDTVAVRAPAAPLLASLAAAVGPLVAPSANRSGRVSATSAAAVADELSGRIDLIVDGGPSPIGVESTVIDLTGAPQLLRPGAVPAGAIEAITGPLATAPNAVGEANAALRSPGLLASHYAPRAALRLNVAPAEVLTEEGWLALGDDPSAARHTVRLSRTGDLGEAARNLYAGLRALDAAGVETIAVSPIPQEGIGAAINDRLARAAAPRPNELARR